jgi:hypothetical protein
LAFTSFQLQHYPACLRFCQWMTAHHLRKCILFTKGEAHRKVGRGTEPQYWRLRVRFPAKTVDIFKWPNPSVWISCFIHPSHMPTADKKSSEGRHLVIANCPTQLPFVVPSFLLLCDT